MKRDAGLLVLGLGCFVALLLLCYGPVLFEARQFTGGNSSFFDYPLYQRVQREWDAGRWPLWDPGQNGGSPLLGNPLAAVFYPGKLLQALLPFAWAARLYVIVHTAVAFSGSLALARTLGTSWTGALLGAMSYAFGAPVLCQYSNTMYLVGAAWIPWGLAALDLLLRQGRRSALGTLAAVLALQVLGGDPEAAYLTAAGGLLYAAVLCAGAPALAGWLRAWWVLPACLGLWAVASLGWSRARLPAPRFLVANGFMLAAWSAAATVLAWRSMRRRGKTRLPGLLARLAAACGLAIALAGVQLLPAVEFLGQTWRSEGVPAANRYRYSISPVRSAELLWPNLFGLSEPENRSWLQALPPRNAHELWLVSLYMSGLVLLLALSAAGWRGGPPWRAWLTTLALLALAASLGRYASPLAWGQGAGHAAAASARGEPHGTQDPSESVSDGTGSPYGLLCFILPGFSAFRYPSKLVPHAAAALAALAAAGWDRAAAGNARRLRPLAGTVLVTSLIALVLAIAARGQVVPVLSARLASDPLFGPADAAGAWAETQRALFHGAIVCAAALALTYWVPRRPRMAGCLALVLLATDLALANARLVGTIPQADGALPSEAARLIDAAERSEPSPGPFRLHRMAGWFPAQFANTRSADRYRELNQWARQTLHPLLALPLNLEYCETIGSLELDDFVALFHPAVVPVPPAMARILGLAAGQPVVYFPRRSFDLWGARYFVLPAAPDLASRTRGLAAFLDKTELLYPSAAELYEQPSQTTPEPWAVRQDWQLRRNSAAYPRAWIVHSAQIRPPALDPETRARRIRSLIYMNDPLWSERGRPVIDLRQSALIESDDATVIRPFLSEGPFGPAEFARVVRYEPQRVELVASLARPGLLILADTYYPGWRLVIDGARQPIFRANRMMRAAALPAGEHTIVFTYEPGSFRAGAFLSTAGVIALFIKVALPRRARPSHCERPAHTVAAAAVHEKPSP
jgi:hypothetical protein